jgi:hypothetical protein
MRLGIGRMRLVKVVWRCGRHGRDGSHVYGRTGPRGNAEYGRAADDDARDGACE